MIQRFTGIVCKRPLRYQMPKKDFPSRVATAFSSFYYSIHQITPVSLDPLHPVLYIVSLLDTAQQAWEVVGHPTVIMELVITIKNVHGGCGITEHGRAAYSKRGYFNRPIDMND